MLSPLTYEQFRSTFGKKMIDVTETAAAAVEIWPYVEELVKKGIVDKYVFNRKLVEHVYRCIENTCDHVLLPTADDNVFIVIVIDRLHKNIQGHFRLDLNEQYRIG